MIGWVYMLCNMHEISTSSVRLGQTMTTLGVLPCAKTAWQLAPKLYFHPGPP